MSPMSQKPKYFVPPEDPSGQLFCKKCGAKLPPNAATYLCQQCTPQDAPWEQVDKRQSQASARQQPRKPSYSGPRYMCPRCHTPVNTAYGRCPRGDFDGKMLPIEAPQPVGSGTPEETGTAPTPVSPPSPAIPQSTVTQQSRAVPDTRPQYACPRCGTKVDPTSNECPDRACGYIGPMQHVEIEQQATGSAYPPSPPTQLRDESAPRTAGEGTIPPSRSPLLDEITTAEPKEPDAIPPQSPLLKEITEGKSRERRISQSARETLPKLVSATRKATRFSGQLIRPSPREWSIPPSTKQLLLRGFWAAIFVAIVGFGGYYAVTHIGNVSLPATSTANPIAIPTPTQTYTLNTNVSPETAGQISPSPESKTYESGMEVMLTATPASGYIFNHWDGDASGSSPTITTAMDSNKSITAYFEREDTTPPVVSEVSVLQKTDITATIEWNTDEPATGEVEYGTTHDYGYTTPLAGELENNHKVTLTGLEPNTDYCFRVKSADESGNEASPHAGTFTTLPAIPVGHDVGNRAIDFGPLPLFDAKKFLVDRDNPKSLSAYRGKKVFLNFWSTRCGACIWEFPCIWEVYKDYCDENSEDADSVVITVCIDGDRPDRIEKIIDKYADDFGPSTFGFPMLLDEERQSVDRYDISIIPKSVFIDSEGIIKEVKIGRFDSPEEIESILERLE